MKYKVKNIDGNKNDIIELICETRGVDPNNLESFINPTKNVVSNPFIYTNMETSAKTIINAAQYFRKIGMIVDADTDGYTSSAMLINYLREVFGFDGIRIYMHEEKAHGLTSSIMEKIMQEPPELLIIPDASSSDFDQHKKLYELGIEIVVIDHHETEKFSEYATVVNNQLDELGNKTLSGGGLVLKLLEAMDVILETTHAQNYYDLAAVALVGDCMLMNVPETRYYVQQGLRNITNPLLYELIRADGNKNYEMISFDIAPTLNAFIRVGTIEERKDLFSALIGYDYQKEITIRGQGTFNLTLPEYIARMASRIKTRQTNMIKKALEDTNTHYINDLPFSICILPNEVEKSLTGLIANRLVESYNKPAIVLKRKGENLFAGSGRTLDTFPDFKSYLIETERFNFCEGHAGAFGCEIKSEELEALCRSHKGETLIDSDCHMVDKAYIDKVSAYDIMQVDELNKHWSRGFDKPLFYIKLSHINDKNVDIIGQKQNTIRIKHDNITYLKFKCDPQEIQKVKECMIRSIELVGSFAINEWNGNLYPQVIIKDFEFEGERKDSPSKFGFNFSNNINW